MSNPWEIGDEEMMQAYFTGWGQRFIFIGDITTANTSGYRAIAQAAQKKLVEGMRDIGIQVCPSESHDRCGWLIPEEAWQSLLKELGVEG